MSSSTAQTAKVAGARRSSKVCQRCHSRKARCDVQLRHPCSGCSQASEPCVLRRRKNARLRSISPPLPDATPAAPERQQQWPLAFPLNVMPETGLYGTDQNETTSDPLASNVASADPVYDYTTLDDLEAIFNPPEPPHLSRIFDPQETYVFRPDADRALVSLQPSHSLSLRHQDFLHACGCFTLPPSATLYHMMQCYVKYTHPNLPILDETELWSLWAGGDFSLGRFSLLLLRAVLFSVSQFLTPDMLSTMGFNSTVEARIEYYTQAKLLFDFEQELDPMISAQACLLLTYFSPNQNTFQVNSHWLTNAVRLAKIAGAHNFFLRPIETDRSRSLKKLWWGVLFRDTILSLVLRRTPSLELNPEQIHDEHILTVGDFTNELGRSPIHVRDTQLRLFNIVKSMCRLTRCLHPGLMLLYRYEDLSDRTCAMRNRIHSILEDIQSHLTRLHRWESQTARLFPSPITLDEDEVSGSVSIFANLLFCYHASAVFAFHLLRLHLFEVGQVRVTDAALKETCEAMELAMDDFGSRLRELLQARLGKCLPITVSAMIALPLVLQAINVTAVRGIEPHEHRQARKLAIFQRTIEIQRSQFDGTDFIFETLSNVSAYAVKENLVPASESDRQSMDGSTPIDPTCVSHWTKLVQSKARPLLRLLFRLDRILCTGGLFIHDEISVEPPAAADQGTGAASNGGSNASAAGYIF